MLQTHLGSADLHATFFPCAKGEGSSGAKGEGSSGASPKKHILQVVHMFTDLTDTRNAVCVGGWVCVGMCVPLCVCVWEWVGGYVRLCWVWRMMISAWITVSRPVVCAGVHAPNVCLDALQPKTKYNFW